MTTPEHNLSKADAEAANVRLLAIRRRIISALERIDDKIQDNYIILDRDEEAAK